MRLTKLFDSLLNQVRSSNARQPAVRDRSPSSRRLRLESLEKRELLSAGDYLQADDLIPPSLSEDYIFNLNSCPDSSYVIYLDFDGHVNEKSNLWTRLGTADKYGKDLDKIVTPAFDLDGDTSSFSDEELQAIYEIWLRVSEDFVPFNVNVTTTLQSRDQLVKSNNSDTSYGLRVCIGGSCYDWYCVEGTTGCGGVASSEGNYVDDVEDFFGKKYDLPVYVFPENLGLDSKSIADAISHEAGHSLGLSHDGRKNGNSYEEYYEGSDGWGSIMGNAYSQQLSQWSKGQYKYANNQEDDLSIITSNGFGYRSDETGIRLLSDIYYDDEYTPAICARGIISTPTDVDNFCFDYNGIDDLTFCVGGIDGITNLDVLVKLYDSEDNLVETFNPADSLSAIVKMKGRDEGFYFFSVMGTGLVKDGKTIYTDYGSLGMYLISRIECDAYESNNQQSDAYDLGTITSVKTLTLPNVWLTSVSGDSDWYKFKLSPEVYNTPYILNYVELKYKTSTSADLHLELYIGDAEVGHETRSKSGLQTVSTVSLSAYEAITYYVRVYNADNKSLENVHYSLSICPPVNIVVSTSQEPVVGAKVSSQLCVGSSSLDSALGNRVTYQWYRVASNGTQTAIKGATGSSYTPDASDVGYALRVVATSRFDKSQVTANVSTVSDKRQTATNLGPLGGYKPRSVSGSVGTLGDSTWYKFTLSSPVLMYINLKTSSLNPGVKFALCDAKGDMIAESITHNGYLEQIPPSEYLTAGTYYIVAYNTRNVSTSVNYTLTLGVYKYGTATRPKKTSLLDSAFSQDLELELL